MPERGVLGRHGRKPERDDPRAMGLMLTRLVFLAFIGLTGFITYNALYLQELRNQTVVPKIIRGSVPPAAPQTGGRSRGGGTGASFRR